MNTTLPKQESIIDSQPLLTFENHSELIKTLRNLSGDLVCLIGYIDENGDIQRFSQKTLETEIEKAVAADRRLLFSKAEFVFHKTQRGRYMPDVHLFRQELKHYFEIDSLSHNKEVK